MSNLPEKKYQLRVFPYPLSEEDKFLVIEVPKETYEKMREYETAKKAFVQVGAFTVVSEPEKDPLDQKPSLPMGEWDNLEEIQREFDHKDEEERIKREEKASFPFTRLVIYRGDESSLWNPLLLTENGDWTKMDKNASKYDGVLLRYVSGEDYDQMTHILNDTRLRYPNSLIGSVQMSYRGVIDVNSLKSYGEMTYEREE